MSTRLLAALFLSGFIAANCVSQAQAAAPELHPSTNALSNFSTFVGVASTNQSFNLSASNLVGRVNFSVTNGYEISTSTNTGFVTNLVVGAFDNATNYPGGWTNGANGGSGFGPWLIAAGQGSGAAGVFIGNPADAGIGGMATNSFALFANPTNSGSFANAERVISNALAVGQSLMFQWGINYDSGSGGNKGFSLLVGTTEVVNVNNAGSAAITLNGSDVGFGYGTNVMTWSFTRTASNTLGIMANDRDGSGTFITNIVVSDAAISALKFYASAMQSGDQAQPYFNNLQIAYTNGNITNLPIYVRIGTNAPVTNGLGSRVTIASTSAARALVELSGAVAGWPTISLSTNTLSGLTSVEASPGGSTNLTVSGQYLQSSISIDAPLHFAVSTNDQDFGPKVSLAPDSNLEVPSTPVYVRIAETAPAGAVTGNVVLTSTNLPAPTNVAVSGTVINWSIANPYGIRVTNPANPLQTNATNFTFSGQIGTALAGANLSWSNWLRGQGGAFTAGSNWTWSASVPLGVGYNTLVFSGQYLTNAGATNVALDASADAAYADGWTSGDNGGKGFGPWQLYSEEGLSALYKTDVWSFTNMNVSAFNSFALESIIGGVANAYRPFSAPLQAPGGSFTVYFDSNELQPGGSVGMQLVGTNKTPLFAFSVVNDGSGPAYQISDKTNSSINPSWAYMPSGLFLRFEMTSSNAYSLTASSATFTNTNTGTISNAAIAGVIFFTDGAGSAPGCNFYLGKMEQNSTLYSYESVSTVAPDVERTTAPLPTAYDTWAQGYGLNPAGNGAPMADPDGDGFANDMEFAFGTNPTLPDTTMLTTSQAGGNMVVTFIARTANVTYAVIQKANLAASVPAWADTGIVPNAASDQSGVPVNYQRRTFSVPATGQNFYRVLATISK